jgi:superfamily I DNA/RNA helicase
MLDEAQDSNNVTLSIFNKFDGKKVIVGDKYQAIYGWRKATNVMEKITADVDLALTTTFRFGQTVANNANNILQEVFGETKTIVPFFPNIERDIKSECRITRTNAALIRELDQLTESTKLFKTVRKPDEIFSMSLSVYYFQMDKWKYKNEITEKRLLQFKSTNEMKDHAKTMKDIELLIAIKLVEDYGERLLDLYDIAKINHRKRANIDIYLTTAHTSKGKEWDSVTVIDDFHDLLDIMLDAKIYSIDDLRKTMKTNYNRVQHVAEEFNLFYVAITRGIVKVSVNSRNYRYLSMSEYELNEELVKMKDVRAAEEDQGWKKNGVKTRKKF